MSELCSLIYLQVPPNIPNNNPKMQAMHFWRNGLHSSFTYLLVLELSTNKLFLQFHGNSANVLPWSWLFNTVESLRIIFMVCLLEVRMTVYLTSLGQTGSTWKYCWCCEVPLILLIQRHKMYSSNIHYVLINTFATVSLLLSPNHTLWGSSVLFKSDKTPICVPQHTVKNFFLRETLPTAASPGVSYLFLIYIKGNIRVWPLWLCQCLPTFFKNVWNYV